MSKSRRQAHSDLVFLEKFINKADILRMIEQKQTGYLYGISKVVKVPTDKYYEYDLTKLLLLGKKKEYTRKEMRDIVKKFYKENKQ